MRKLERSLMLSRRHRSKKSGPKARQFLPPWREERTRAAYQGWRGQTAGGGNVLGSHQDVCRPVMNRDGLLPPPFANTQDFSLSQLVPTRTMGTRLTKKGSATVNERSPRVARKKPSSDPTPFLPFML
jgi:hypothetical protein